MTNTRTWASSDLALQDTGALAAAEYCRLAVWAHSPLFFRSGHRLYRSWTVHQCWCSNLTADSFSFLILAFAYPAFVLHPRFLFVGFRFCFSPFVRTLMHRGQKIELRLWRSGFLICASLGETGLVPTSLWLISSVYRSKTTMNAKKVKIERDKN